MNGTASRTFSTPETKGKQGRPAKDSQTILNGIVWIARSGAPWRDLPARYGPWETVYSRFRKWIDDGVLDTAEKSYSEKHLKKYRKYYNILWRVSKPKDYKRFIIQANSCLTHNAYDDLDKIKYHTLIIGRKQDSVIGVNSSKEIADRISNSELYLYEDYGRAVYEEAKDFNERVLKYWTVKSSNKKITLSCKFMVSLSC